MHIGFYALGWPAHEFTSGIVTYIHNLRAELIRQGHRVSIFARRVGQSNRDSGVHRVEATVKYEILSRLFRLIPWKPYEIIGLGGCIAAKVNEVHRTDPLDVLEMEESFGWSADVQMLTKLPIVVKLHGPAFLTLPNDSNRSSFDRLRIELEGRALRQMRAIVSPSQCTLRDTMTCYGLDPPIRRVIPNPVATEGDLRPWELEECDRKTILFVGRFDTPKGGDTVLIVFRKLLEMDSDLKLIFVGPDRGLTSSDGSTIRFEEFRNSLFTEAQRRNITYLGQLGRSDILELRRRAYVTLVTSRWESQGYTALEAMIQGCPVVANDAGGLSETVEDGVTGLLARSNDIEDLCRKVMSLMNDPVRARQLGANARRFVAERHAARKLADEAVEVYRQAISMAKAGSR